MASKGWKGDSYKEGTRATQYQILGTLFRAIDTERCYNVIIMLVYVKRELHT